MSYLTLGAIISGEWDATVATKGTIEHNDITNYHEIFYGVTYEDTELGLGEMGFSREIADDMVGDKYLLYVVGENRSEVNLQIKALQKICINWQGDLTDIYRKLYLPDLGGMVVRHDEFTQEGTWRYARVPLLGRRVGESNIS
jgi:hypothetical protein